MRPATRSGHPALGITEKWALGVSGATGAVGADYLRPTLDQHLSHTTWRIAEQGPIVAGEGQRRDHGEIGDCTGGSNGLLDFV